MTKQGYFIISLDFELMWGVKDVRTISNYGDAIIGGRDSFDPVLKLFKEYGVSATIAIVGFLFNKNREDFNNKPSILPTYKNKNYNAYSFIEQIGENEMSDPYHYAGSIIDKIKSYTNHEIATHTYSHYYCLEEGQNEKQFEADLLKAIEVANKHEIDLKSIIFPRNQCNKKYLEICKRNGIETFRGTEQSWFYKTSDHGSESLLKRLGRLADAYTNLSGYNCYSPDNKQAENIPLNFPSSRLLRAYNKKLNFIEKYKLNRIKKAMSYAAKNNKVYHLWWHPHNFGRDMEENLALLEKILLHYKNLNNKYGYESITMYNLASKVKE